jgi:chromosome segregation ATPase
MIQEIFLKRAYNIRKEYLGIRNNIDDYERNVKLLLRKLEEKSFSLQDLKDKIDSNKIHDPEMAKSELLKIMMELEDEINNNDGYINRLNTNIDRLKEDEISLFRDIKQRYPEMTDSEIKNEVQDYIKKLNLS